MIIFYGVYPVAVFLYNIRFNNSILFIFVPGNNIMAFALQRFLSNNILFIIYVSYDVLLIIIFPLFSFSVIIFFNNIRSVRRFLNNSIFFIFVPDNSTFIIFALRRFPGNNTFL